MSAKTQYPWQRFANNPLIVKDDVGKAKPATYKIPDVAFGQTTKFQKFEESLKDVLQPEEHIPSSEIRPPTDFIRLNKATVKSNMVTAKEFQQFRQYNDIRQSVSKGQLRGKDTIPIKCFGRPNKPSSPIRDVLFNCYGAKAEERQQEAYSSRPSTAKSRQSVETKSSKLLRESIKRKINQSESISKEPNKKYQKIEAKVKSRY